MKAPLFVLCTLAVWISQAGAEMRTFHNTKGEKIEAEIVSATAEKAELKRADGKVFNVPVNTLSEEDRQYIDKWRSTHKQVKIGVTADVKRAITREEKGEPGGEKMKGNDSWFVLNLKNSGAEALTGLRVESIIFAPAGAPKVMEITGEDIAVINPGKSLEVKTAKLFVPQAVSIVSSGTSTARRYTEGTPAGVYAELLIGGKRVGIFKAGYVAQNEPFAAQAEQQLLQWRAGQPATAPAVPKEQPKKITPGVPETSPGTKVGSAQRVASAEKPEEWPPVATFSIVARDPETGEIGVAVQSKFFGVGAVVPWAKAGVGAVATQSYANTTWGPEGLKLLGEGKSPEETLATLTKADTEAVRRQAGIIAPSGKPATFTGEKCMDWAGGRAGEHYAAQGNILAGQPVVDGMAEAFEKTTGALAEKMLAALDAAQAAGGDTRGMQSAAILIVRDGWGYAGLNDRWIDLRVDDHAEPLKELRRLYGEHQKIYRRKRE